MHSLLEIYFYLLCKGKVRASCENEGQKITHGFKKSRSDTLNENRKEEIAVPRKVRWFVAIEM